MKAHGYEVIAEDDEIVIYMDGHQIAMFGENSGGKRVLIWSDGGEEPTHSIQLTPEVHHCQGCGREESECSANPCEAVIADREEYEHA